MTAHRMTPAARDHQLRAGRHSAGSEQPPAEGGGRHRAVEWPTHDTDSQVSRSRRIAERVLAEAEYAAHCLHVLLWAVVAEGVVILFAYAIAVTGDTGLAAAVLLTGTGAVLAGIGIWCTREIGPGGRRG